MKNGPFKNQFIGKAVVLFCLVIHGCQDSTSNKEPAKGRTEEKPVVDKSMEQVEGEREIIEAIESAGITQ